MKIKDKIMRLCRELLLGEDSTPKYENDPIPISFSIDYAKRCAAEELGKLSDSAISEAALIRAALTENENDQVRTEAVQQLFNNHSPHVEVVLIGLLFDSDELMRLTGLEGLALMNSEYLPCFVDMLKADHDNTVQDSINQWEKDPSSIKLWRLDQRTN